MFRLANISRRVLSATAPVAFKQTTRSTTILCVRKDGKVMMGGDGQVSQGSSVVKPNARKVRKIGDNIVVGFAGSTADAITLLERLEKKIEEHSNQLMRACVELAKDWRTDKYLRKLEATLIVADKDHTFEITGNGDVLEPHENVMAVGSGGHFAQAAALALIDVPDYDADRILRKAMKIAGDACVYTNHNLIVESVDTAPVAEAAATATSTTNTSGKKKKE